MAGGGIFLYIQENIIIINETVEKLVRFIIYNQPFSGNNKEK